MSSGRELCPAVAVLACAIAALACKDDPAPREAVSAAPPPAPAPRLAPPVVVGSGSNVVVLDQPKVELPKQESFALLDAGKGARAPLRYKLAEGTARFFAETRLSSRHLDRGVFTPAVALPAIRDGFAITVAADRPATLALLPLPGEAATASADADAYLGPWRTLLQNRRVAIALDDRGAFSAVRFNDDPTGARSHRAHDELIQRLLSLIVPLPAEPVGAGASWRVVTILRQGPAYAKQTATYTLISRGPVSWKLHARLQRVGEEQRISDPALPAGTTADLLALFRNLEGDIEVDPARPLITGGSLAIESRLHVKLTAPGQSAAQATEQIFEDTGSVAFSHQPNASP